MVLGIAGKRALVCASSKGPGLGCARALADAGTSRQVAGRGMTINNLLPGLHATDRALSLDGPVAEKQGITLEETQAQRSATIPSRRYGTAEEFGQACAFLCSQHAGFIVDQNLLLDGGATNRTM